MAALQAKAALAHVHAAQDYCPTCGQEIPETDAADFKRRLEARERQTREEAEQRQAVAVAAALSQARNEAQSNLSVAKAQVAAAEQQIAALIANQETILNDRLVAMRETLERSAAEAVAAERVKHFDETQKLRSLAEELQRKLENKSVVDLGEGAEIDLIQALRAEFPDDDITNILRGKAGADIVHKVRYKGTVCGTILYDSKNHQQWRNDHALKLRHDQIEAKADHAVLSTRAFPKDRTQLHIENGVILANPARAVVVAMLLRQQCIQLHSQKVSNEARGQKTDELYAWMTSERFQQFLSAINRSVEQLEALHAQEKKAHEAAWKKQGELFRSIVRSCAQFDSDIARIIGMGMPDQPA